MTVEQIKKAVDEGKTVHWFNSGYKVIKDKHNQYLIMYSLTGDCIGLTNKAGDKLNGKEEEFYTVRYQSDFNQSLDGIELLRGSGLLL